MPYKSAYRLLDVGGTFIKCADGSQIPISSGGSREEIAAALKEAVGSLEGVRGIGIAIPGPFNYKEGIFLMEHKFAAVKGESFRTLADVPENMPLRFHHDVNVVLRGAVHLLGLQDKNTALATLGTGLGFTYALHGAVQYNPMGSPARHLWNIPFEGGVLEDAVSGRGIRTAYERKTGEVGQSALTIAKRAYAGDPVAIEVYERVGALLGQAVREKMQDIPLDTLFIGGQIGKSLSLMLPPLQDALEGVKICRAPEDAVFVGLESLFDNNT